jgi:hypothetical protein
MPSDNAKQVNWEIKQITFDPSAWQHGKWMVLIRSNYLIAYLCGDGLLYSNMQKTSNSKGGTYFSTYEEAKACLDKAYPDTYPGLTVVDETHVVGNLPDATKVKDDTGNSEETQHETQVTEQEKQE